MPIANVNRIVRVNNPSANFHYSPAKCGLAYMFFHNSNKFYRFLLGREITNLHRMTDSAVLFHKPITTGEKPIIIGWRIVQHLGCGKLTKLNRFTACQSPSAILLGGEGTWRHRMTAKWLQTAIGWRVVQNWLADCQFTKTILFTFQIGMIFASTTYLFEIIIKNIKKHFKKM